MADADDEENFQEDEDLQNRLNNGNVHDFWGEQSDYQIGEEDPLSTNGIKRNLSEKSKEDLEFEQMFEKMTQDCYQERLKESVKPNTKDIAVPMMVRNTKKTFEQLNNASNVSGTATVGGTTAQASIDGTSVSNTVPFVLMVRGSKGGKQQFKQFAAPSDSQLAINLRLQEEKIREEKEKVKRLTLNITERIEEEDYQDSMMQNQRNYHHHHVMVDPYARSTKPKFKHQKGAPDADLIFH